MTDQFKKESNSKKFGEANFRMLLEQVILDHSYPNSSIWLSSFYSLIFIIIIPHLILYQLGRGRVVDSVQTADFILLSTSEPRSGKVKPEAIYFKWNEFFDSIQNPDSVPPFPNEKNLPNSTTAIPPSTSTSLSTSTSTSTSANSKTDNASQKNSKKK